MAITIDQAGIVEGSHFREQVFHRIAKAQADDIARALGRWNREIHVRAGALQSIDNVVGRVDDGAIPVEHQQIKTLSHQSVLSPGNSLTSRRSLAMNCANSAGSGACTSTRRPSSGCRNASAAACRNMRLSPDFANVLFNAKSPYLSSPAIGNPKCARWTRI